MKKVALVLLLLSWTPSFGDGFNAGQYVIILSPQWISLGSTIGNVIQISVHSTHGRVVPVFGFIFGAISTAEGIAILTSNGPQEKYFGTLALTTGVLALGTSLQNVLRSWQPKDASTSWNLYSFPTKDKGVGMGLTLSRRF